MFLKVSDKQSLRMDDLDNFKAFHIEANMSDISGSDPNKRFVAMSEPAEEGRFWLDANEIVALSGRADDPNWTGDFWKMLEKVEPYGFADIKAKRVKAHVINPE